MNSSHAWTSRYIAEDQDDKDWDNKDGLLHLNHVLQAQSCMWWEDPVSGCPLHLEDFCMMLIDLGFCPDTCTLLSMKLCEVVHKAVRLFTAKYQFVVPMLCLAFIVPGEYSLLLEARCGKVLTFVLSLRSIQSPLSWRDPCQVLALAFPWFGWSINGPYHR